MRSGLAGIVLMTASSAASASLIAFVMAAGGAIAPPSPTPLIPFAEYGERAMLDPELRRRECRWSGEPDEQETIRPEDAETIPLT